jgi:hypothetical protein
LTKRLNGVGEARKKVMARLTTSLAAFIVNARESSLRFARPQSSQQIGASLMFEKISLAMKYSGKRN